MMRHLLLSFIISISLILIFSCGSDEENIVDDPECIPIDLSGDWLGKGYRCQMNFTHETIAIQHNLMTEDVMAIRVTGDSCVLAGDVNFTGKYDGCTETFDILWIRGTPQNPSSDTEGRSVRVFNDSSMTVFGLAVIDFERLN